jgi:Glyoxalase/Bleomycin resistance protein/Dioxygenase superfamily
MVAAVSAVALAIPTPMSGTEEAPFPALGVPDHVGIAVSDLDRAQAQLADGTGTRFDSMTSSTVAVELPGEANTRSITLHRAHSQRGEPFLVLEQASPAIGPWAPDGGAAPTFLSYAVPDVHAAGEVLRRAGFEPAATADEFTFWKGTGGVLVRLWDAEAAPGRQADATTDDLGPIRSVTFAPCATDALKQQLSQGLGVAWKTRILLPLPWWYEDERIRPVVHQVDASQDRGPHITLETPDPARPCTADRTPAHIIYFATDVGAAERRLASSGMSFVARAAPLVTYFRGADDYYIQVGSTAFQLAELIP